MRRIVGREVGTSVAGYVMDHCLLLRDSADGGSAQLSGVAVSMGLAILNVRHAALDDVHSRAVFNFDGSTVIRSDN